MRRGTVAAAALLWSLGGCGSSGSSGENAGNAGNGAGDGGSQTVLWKDDFSDAKSGWTLQNSGGTTVAYVDGRLRLAIDNDASQYVRAESDVAKSFDDAVIRVTAAKTGGSDGLVLGVKCRVGPKGGYFFDVTPDGETRIYKYELAEQTVLASGEGVSVDASHVTVGARCTGSTLVLEVDGKDVLSARDTAYTSGTIGLLAGGAGSGKTEVFFDDLVVTAP